MKADLLASCARLKLPVGVVANVRPHDARALADQLLAQIKPRSEAEVRQILAEAGWL